MKLTTRHSSLITRLRLLALSSSLSALSFLAGCATPPPAPDAADEVGRLLEHPQFAAAAQAAPQFTDAALKTVSRLQADNRALRATAK